MNLIETFKERESKSGTVRRGQKECPCWFSKIFLYCFKWLLTTDQECLNFVRCPRGKGIYQQKDWICRGLFMPCDNSGASQHMYIFLILWIFQEKFRRMPWTGAPSLCLVPSGEEVWKSETIKALFSEGAVCLSLRPLVTICNWQPELPNSTSPIPEILNSQFWGAETCVFISILAVLISQIWRHYWHRWQEVAMVRNNLKLGIGLEINHVEAYYLNLWLWVSDIFVPYI